MFARARMPVFLSLIVGLFVVACNEPPAPFKIEDRSPRADRDAPFDPPSEYSEWAYDSESYMRPVEDLQPEPKVGPNDPLHYFTNKKVVMIRQPSGYTAEQTPRVAVWWTDNNGFRWQKAGYFGRGQTYFPFEVEEDGDYGVRFVGPGQPEASNVPAYPERVYHVDTQLPSVELTVEPEQTWYHPGQTITMSWRAEDFHLVEFPVKIGLLMDFAAQDHEPAELQRDVSQEGTITFTIPQEALDHEIRFRVDALDRAGNLGTAVSYALQVVTDEVADGSQSPAAGEAGEAEESEAEETAETDRVGLAEPLVGPPNVEDPLEAEEIARVDDPPVMVPLTPPPFGTDSDGDLFNWDEPFFATSTDGATSVAPVYLEIRTNEAVAASEAATPEPEATGDVLVNGIPPNSAVAEFHASPSFPPHHEATVAVARPLSSDAAEKADAPSRFSGLQTEPAAPAEAAGTAAGSGSDAWVRLASDTFMDPTYGNGLMVPLPATVDAIPLPQGRSADAHPWRLLRDRPDEISEAVWALPRTRYGIHLNGVFEGRFLADHQALRPAGEPAAVTQALAGLSAEDGTPSPGD